MCVIFSPHSQPFPSCPHCQVNYNTCTYRKDSESSSPQTNPQLLESNTLNPLFVSISEVVLMETIHTHTQAHTHTNIYAYIYTGMHTHAHICTHTYIHNFSKLPRQLLEAPRPWTPGNPLLCGLGWEEFNKREESALFLPPGGCLITRRKGE